MIEPLTPEWHEARRQGIGASEIAAVLGISPWESPLSLYWRKVNGWTWDGNDNTRTGTILEPVIAQWGARWVEADHERYLYIAPSPLLAHPDRPWQLATPDRIVRERHQCGPHDYALSMGCMCEAGHKVAVLECKWTGSWDGWGDEGTDDIPVYYRAQVLWQCDVVGVDRWYVAVLGPSGFRMYWGQYDKKDLAVMVEAGRRFMARLEAQDPPPIDDHTATLATLRRLHPSLVDETTEVPDELGAGYLRASAMVKKAEALKRKYEAAIREHAGPARTITTASGRKVATHVITDATVKAQPERVDHRDYLLAALPRSKRS